MFVLFNVRIMFGNIKKKFKQRLNVRVTWAKLTKHTHTQCTFEADYSYFALLFTRLHITFDRRDYRFKSCV